jgi:CRP/FNR family transcriptional regulator, nitrogen oxide reductase regulator
LKKLHTGSWGRSGRICLLPEMTSIAVEHQGFNNEQSIPYLNLNAMDKNTLMTSSFLSSDVFRSLSDEQIAHINRSGFYTTLKTKSQLFRQGDSAQKCYLITRGCLKLIQISEMGKEVILRYIGNGELAAAVAVLKDKVYPVTAEAVEETEAIGWDRPTFLNLMRKYPDIGINILRIVIERLDDVQHRYTEQCTEHVEQRIARSLLRLMQRAGSKTPEGIHIAIPLSRQNIADYAGTTLFTVSRNLSAWEKNGWVKTERKRIIVTNPHAMVMIAEKE